MRWVLIVLLAFVSCTRGSKPSSLLYEGKTPCADCSGITVDLILDVVSKDSTFEFLEKYEGKNSNNYFEGKWKINPKKHCVVIGYDKPEQTRYFRVVSNDSLKIMDKQGNEIGDNFDYYLVHNR